MQVGHWFLNIESGIEYFLKSSN